MRMPRSSIAAVTMIFVAGCAPAVKAAPPAPVVAARPRLTSIVPDSVRLLRGNVTEIELKGSGFDATPNSPDNTVRIGSLVLRNVPSRANGTAIRVAIPATVPSGGEAPPAAWMGGRYPVTVTTKSGTSDTLTVAIAAGGGRP